MVTKMFRTATVCLVVLLSVTNCGADTINYNRGGHSLRNRNISHQYPTGYKNWKWGNVGRTKPNDADRLESLINIPVDEKWMRRLDLPSLHLILANYAEAAARTAWLRNVGRPFRSRLLQLLLRSNIRRFSGTVGDIDIEPESRQRVNSFLLSPCSSGMIETGVCLSTPVCSLVGGARMNGNCYFGKTCCVINKVETSCSASVAMNNTFWQSTPSGLNSGYTCAINIQLNSAPLTRKYPPICQVRLDFDLFSIAQPTPDSTCSTDTFQVTGSTNNVPVICGDNARQHMYLMSTSAPTKIQMLFSFGESTAYVDRSWRIKIALLPCTADYLAPASCLQYFTSSTGNVKSFGWKDLPASSTSVSQLANQNYKICFRPELNQNGQIPMSFCVSECASTSGRAFSLSRNSIDDITSSAGGTGVAPEDMCAFDFILLAGGYDTAGDTNDRFCGNRLSANPGTAASATICTTMKPFSIFYVTNGQELDTNSNPVQADVGNNGFCLTFTQF